MSDKDVDLFDTEVNSITEPPTRGRPRGRQAAPVVAESAPAPEAEAPKPQTPAEKQAKRPAGWRVIIIDEQEGENNYCFVGDNGVDYQLMRGVPVAVPPGVLEILNQAVAHRLVQVVDPRTGRRENQNRPYLRFPYRIVE